MNSSFCIFDLILQLDIFNHASFRMTRNVARELNVVVTVEMPQ